MGQVGKEPLQRHHGAIAEADQQHDVDAIPQHPRDEAAQSDPPEHRDRRIATDRGQIAEVAVAEWWRFGPEGQVPPQGAPQVPALLLCRCGQAGQVAPVGTDAARQVADYVNGRQSSNGQISAYRHAAMAVERHSQTPAERRGRHSRSPNDGCRGNHEGNHEAAGSHPGLGHCMHLVAEPHGVNRRGKRALTHFWWCRSTWHR